MHIVAQLRPIDLHNFSGQLPESSQLLGASKLPLFEWTSLDAGTKIACNVYHTAIPAMPRLLLGMKKMGREIRKK
jgi:hypothetical protein